MAGIRIGLRDGLPAPVVPLPHKARFAEERFRRRQVPGLVLFPHAFFASKGRDAALGGNAGAGERGNLGSFLDPLAGLFHRPYYHRVTGQGATGWRATPATADRTHWWRLSLGQN